MFAPFGVLNNGITIKNDKLLKIINYISRNLIDNDRTRVALVFSGFLLKSII